jgi:hypothetical protein
VARPERASSGRAKKTRMNYGVQKIEFGPERTVGILGWPVLLLFLAIKAQLK